MKLGLGSVGDASVQQLISDAALADRLGFDTIWLADHYCLRELVVCMTAVSMSTKRIRVASGTANPFTRHPAAYAMALATLTELAGNRFTFGLGASVRPQSRLFGKDFEHQLKLLREYIVVLRKLLAGEEVTFEGIALNVKNLKLDFEVRPKTPIYLGAIGPKMLELAGELCDGLIVTAGASTGFSKQCIKRFKQIASEAGRDPMKLSTSVLLFTSVSEDSEKAKNHVRRWLATLLSQPYFDRIARASNVDLKEVERVKSIISLEGVEKGALKIPSYFVDEFSVAGTPSECKKRIEEYSATGATELVLLPQPPDPAKTISTMATVLRHSILK